MDSLVESKVINDLSVYKPTFKKKEFDDRIINLRKILKSNDLDCIVLFSPHLLYYFTGFTGWSFYVPQFFYINKTEKYLILRGMDAAAANSTTYLEEKEILIYPDYYVDNEHLHPIQLFSKLIKPTDKIGLELNGNYSKASYYLEFVKLCKSIMDITLLINNLRSIKSKGELKYIRRAAKIADKSIQKAINYISEGKTTAQVVGKIINKQLSMGGTYTGLAPMLMVDEKSAHMNWSNHKLKRGQIVNIEMAGSYLHYHCPIARTIFIGNKEDLKNSIYRNIYQIEDCLHKAMAAILELIKPGVEVKIISSCFNKILEEGEIKKNHESLIVLE